MRRELIQTALWDLRTEYESELRTLTAAQKCVDEWIRASTAGEAARPLGEVRKHVAALVKNNADVALVLADISAVVAAPPKPRRR